MPDDRPISEEGGRWSYAAEMIEAGRAFYDASVDEPFLRILMLVNPIRAFADAGIQLSRSARKRLREDYPEMAWDNDKLYDRVQSGEVVLDFIAEVRLGETRGIDDDQGGAGEVEP